ncbi:MAG: pyruvate kinase [Acidiferrobacterales bacterium]|nr:pyruvate kinase [Acidiferrobacterales bacterium]
MRPNTVNRLRKTKVIATIGPACDDTDTLVKMIQAGMNVARLNMSHGNAESHAATLQRVQEAANIAGTTVAIMVDNRGREIRTCKVESDAVMLERHQKFSLYGDNRLGNSEGVSLTFDRFHHHAQPGERVLIDDGQIELVVESVDDEAARCKVICGGQLKNSKGVNFPDNTSALDDIEHDDSLEVDFAASHKVEYFAASFIRNAAEINALRTRFDEHSVEIGIIAKIENREGVENIEEIVEASDGVMVARGDLGVELNMGEGPKIQKQIIRATVSRGKPVITATQMLDSMERNPRPTRAEVNDVANAIFDGSSAVMLSGETAAGSRPVESVKTMATLALEAESGLKNYGFLQSIEPNPSNEVTEAVAQASITMANHLNAAAIIALTETGFTSRLISKYRPESPILAITTSPVVVQKLSMNWGVLPMLYDGKGDDEDKIRFAIENGKQLGYLFSGDLLILTAGNTRQAGSTDLIRVLSVED